MIVITGAAGFIGSCLAAELNAGGENALVLVDDFSSEEKIKNMDGKHFKHCIEREKFIEWFADNADEISLVLHIGARTDTTEFNKELLFALNTQYTKEIWKICTQHAIPLIYASSAATYGAGELGYNDDHKLIPQLQPLNPYGESKNAFDIWALQQEKTPPKWIGLKFFNVYGPNEYHKSRMASVIMHAYNQIQENGKVKLFRSHKEAFNDGEQLRDFIYVKDVVQVISWMCNHDLPNGIYNLGTGNARTFYDLAKATANAMEIPLEVDWINIPEDIRNTYQYFTEATMQKLKDAGYNSNFYSLEEGITDYVKNYLIPNKYY
ncbi:MAG: ADP-glyceromanno-heptose 6-epimerase [Bacteroidetes bacterium]|nr:ADP-glyceromanno-heptose 6-epimerase [Bacteroidota bacterium]MBK8680486.1 ADP-glyceromanno-heptose 6-epimerase [Bacteroidota bacterium]